jgi:hypothetical protein
MLILKVYVNNKQIDEIWVHNKGRLHKRHRYSLTSYHEYAIVKPTGIEQKFYHRRSDGWKPLINQVLKHLEELEEIDK